jgi:hypothetical protein
MDRLLIFVESTQVLVEFILCCHVAGQTCQDGEMEAERDWWEKAKSNGVVRAVSALGRMP